MKILVKENKIRGISEHFSLEGDEVIYFFYALSFGITGAPDCTRRQNFPGEGPRTPNGRGRPLPIHSPMSAPPTKEGAQCLSLSRLSLNLNRETIFLATTLLVHHRIPSMKWLVRNNYFTTPHEMTGDTCPSQDTQHEATSLE